MRRDRGFTAIELMVVVAVLGILLVWAVPAFDRLREKMRLVRAIQPVFEMVVYAHSEAVKRFRPIVVSFSPGSNNWAVGATDKAACTATVTDPGDASACTIDADNNASTTTDRMLTRVSNVDLPGDLPIVAMSEPEFPASGNTYTVFEGVRGLPLEGTTARNGQVTLSTTNFSASVQVAVSGNIRICSPAGATKVSWYPDC